MKAETIDLREEKRLNITVYKLAGIENGELPKGQPCDAEKPGADPWFLCYVTINRHEFYVVYFKEGKFLWRLSGCGDSTWPHQKVHFSQVHVTTPQYKQFIAATVEFVLKA